MKKPFLLIVNDQHYPRGGTRDWVGFFETENEAKEIVKNEYPRFYNDIEGSFTIVNIRDWIEGYELE